MNENSFSIKDTLWAAWREYAEKRRVQNLRLLALACFATLGVFCMLWSTSGDDREYTFRNLTGTLSAAVALLYLGYWAVSCFSASMMLDQLTTREKRLGFFMAPVGVREKYWGQWLFYVVGFTLMYIVIALVALTLGSLLARIAFPSMFDYEMTETSLVGSIVNEMFPSRLPFRRLTTILLLFLAPIANSSFFVAGSAYFGRHSFVKTLIGMWAFQMVLGMVFGVSALIFFRIAPGFEIFSANHTFSNGLESAIPWLVMAAMLAISGFNWWAGSYRLRETDI
ncbi:MAG: hypothetical protein NC336_01655 [Clostridium sp.]|nr:hypothetical protein [Clostridium sp.]